MDGYIRLNNRVQIGRDTILVGSSGSGVCICQEGKGFSSIGCRRCVFTHCYVCIVIDDNDKIGVKSRFGAHVAGIVAKMCIYFHPDLICIIIVISVFRGIEHHSSFPVEPFKIGIQYFHQLLQAHFFILINQLFNSCQAISRIGISVCFQGTSQMVYSTGKDRFPSLYAIIEKQA